MDLPLILVYTAWVLVVFEFDWFLSRTIGGPFYSAPTILAPFLALVAMLYGTRRVLYWPVVVFILLHVAALVYAENRGIVVPYLKVLIHMYLVFMASVAVIDSPSKAVPILKMFLLGFVWYGIQGLPNGRVGWNLYLGNEDSYGPFMGLGLGFSYYFALAAKSRWWRRIGYATCLLCLVGVVASFARGAVLSAALVLFVVWLRSPHKIATLAAAIGAAGVFFVAVDTLFPAGEFWVEMATISEGAQEGTGASRLELWKMAWTVFLEHPIFGVGARNFGVVASQIIPYDPTRTDFIDSAVVWGKGLHSIYFQVLSEEGIIGVIAWVAMLVGFVRRASFLRTRPASDEWSRRGCDGFDLANLSRGLEVAMVAYLANGFFYNQIYTHWFWTLILMMYVLSEVSGGFPNTRDGKQLSSQRRKPLP
jgi:O-antigen ligase